MGIANRTIRTTHADIAISETGGTGLPVLLIHGNSGCKEVFSKQLESDLGDRFRMIAMDLPGHGDSSPAVVPENTYSWLGYADCAIQVLKAMGVKQAAVYGWSLGGQAAIEMLPGYDGMAGLMITGAPPVSPTMESIQAGFLPSPVLMLAGQEVWSDAEHKLFGDAVFGKLDEPELRKASYKTDPAARRVLLESLMAGKASDQRLVMENAAVPVAVVNGSEDPLVNLDYVNDIRYARLWDEHCYVMRGLGHMPFRESPAAFNALFGRFLAEMEQRAAEGKTARTVLPGAKTAAA